MLYQSMSTKIRQRSITTARVVEMKASPRFQELAAGGSHPDWSDPSLCCYYSRTQSLKRQQPSQYWLAEILLHRRYSQAQKQQSKPRTELTVNIEHSIPNAIFYSVIFGGGDPCRCGQRLG
ncbi:hypothetical protein FGO68_gene2095 [Halteria grandinella]|uniref:Uncharacterized protein n=1 Tax=Halteria grandinella TaxID=5974 RepID=A0A8J8NNH7_HALGN|nr:hypothetical protein FGO68_gene2095 [Halteria grandinella]